jgi:hypothetical protein
MILAGLALSLGCGEDAGGNGTDDTSTRDVRGRRDTGVIEDAIDDRGADVNIDAGPTVDAATSDIAEGCDQDRDGHAAERCGGDDCDDTRREVHGGMAEFCDELDNDCDDVLNNGINCTFFAHTDEELYRVDPFNFTAELVITLPATLWDIDTHPNGSLYAISDVALYVLDERGATWNSVGGVDPQGAPNGLAIDNEGTAYVTSGNFLYTVDLLTAEVTWVGSMGGGFESSGDCVVNKDNTLLMASRHRTGTDTIIRINGATAEATEVGDIGVTSVFGLTAAWGTLYGLTSRGELIEIDESTGAGRLLHTFSGHRWFGAASTPTR